MKNKKQPYPFEYKNITKLEAIDLFNDLFPIDLRYNEELIDRVHNKYPYCTKSEISIVVTAIFSSFRELLIFGKVLNFNKLFFNTKLHPYLKRNSKTKSPNYQGKKNICIAISNSIPPDVRWT